MEMRRHQMIDGIVASMSDCPSRTLTFIDLASEELGETKKIFRLSARHFVVHIEGQLAQRTLEQVVL